MATRAMAASDAPTPTEIKLHQKSRVLEISFSDGQALRAAVRVPARVLALGRSARSRPGTGGPADRQEGRGHPEPRAGREATPCSRTSPTATPPASIPGTICTSSASNREADVAELSRAPQGGRRAARALSAMRSRKPASMCRMSRDRLRLSARRRGGESGPRRRRLLLGRGQVRPHERPDVGRPAPAVEGLHGDARGRARGRARARRRRAARAIWRSNSRSAPAAGGEVWLTDINRAMLERGATACSTAACRSRRCSATRRRCRFRRTTSTASASPSGCAT